jgi:hypothetical protein
MANIHIVGRCFVCVRTGVRPVNNLELCDLSGIVKAGAIVRVDPNRHQLSILNQSNGA